MNPGSDQPARPPEGVEARISALEQTVLALQERNRRVERDKAWEVSRTRTAGIAGLTYLVSAAVLYAIDSSRPLLGAAVPTVGYLLSRLTMHICRRWWSGAEADGDQG